MPTQTTQTERFTKDDQPGEIRALSLWQPWASLLAAGIKKAETRSKNTVFRGEFYIHATASLRIKTYEDYYLRDPEFRGYVNQLLNFDYKTRLTFTELSRALPTGALIGKATLVDTMSTRDYKKTMREASRLVDLERERTLGDLDDGRYVWICNDHGFLPEPIPCKGQQSIFWRVP